jgi:hypothetical protein
VLEPAFDHGFRRALHFLCQHDVDEPGGNRRAEEASPLEGRVGVAERLQQRLGHRRRHLFGPVERLGGNRAGAGVDPMPRRTSAARRG